MAGLDTELLTIDQAKARYDGPLIGIVLHWLATMDGIVNRDKQPPITRADWAPLGELVDRETFRRVGNYGVKNDWDSYQDLLVAWANMSWWKGLIGRVREVPGQGEQPSLLYMETEERSNRAGPVKDDGNYSVLASIAVYEIADDGRITRLHVYDQRPN